MIRSCGLADVLVVDEATAVAAIRDLYDFAAPPTAEQIAELAETWRPFRTWAAVLLRAAAPRLAA